MMMGKSLDEQSIIFPWSHLDKSPFSWPTLEWLSKENKVSYLDCAVAYQILSSADYLVEGAALFIAYLSTASRRGHLCVDLSEEKLNPSLEEVWSLPNEETVSTLLTKKIIEAAQKLPETIKNKMPLKGLDHLPLEPICSNGDLYYLQKQWVFESECLKFLTRHLKGTPYPSLSESTLKKILEEKIASEALNEEQAEAILASSKALVSLIAGGPGTGKTHTAGHLIKILWECSEHSHTHKKAVKIALAAPTGKAAAALQASLKRATKEIPHFPTLQAKTLHALLGMKSASCLQEKIQLDADLLIVDESSMIDLKMMRRLLESLKPNSRLILIGDPCQLASVEAGSLFLDLLEASRRELTLPLASTFLKKCLRVESLPLIHFSESINRGDGLKVVDSLREKAHPSLKWSSLEENPKSLYKKIWSNIEPFFPFHVEEPLESESFFSTFQHFRLLSPLKQGPYGSEAINRSIYEKILLKAPQTGWLLLPIMITANDHRAQLFNGETGLLLRKLPLDRFSEEDYALFPDYSDEEKRFKKLSSLLLPPFDFAYCLSVHKSQGSEFDKILLLLPEGSELFGREVLYTGVTRARKEVEIWGEEEILLKTIKKKGSRRSGFCQRLI